jgi:hypothetical protein
VNLKSKNYGLFEFRFIASSLDIEVEEAAKWREERLLNFGNEKK